METLKWETIAVLGLVVLDVVTGIANACRNKQLNSTKMRDGFYHKFAYFIVLFTGWFIDMLSVRIDLGYGQSHLFDFCAIFICGIEITSIIENVKLLNPDIDNGLLEVFDKPNGPKHSASTRKEVGSWTESNGSEAPTTHPGEAA